MPEDASLQVDEKTGARQGYALDVERYSAASKIKTASDGRTVLIPQPSDSSDDPLNWSAKRKAIMLGIVAFIGFLPDFGAGVSIVAIIPQAM